MAAPPYEPELPPYVDEIPYYSPSLEYYGFAMLKVEFDTPWSCRSAPMKPVVVELNSNQLRLYEFAGDKSVISVVESLFIYQNFDDGSTNAYGSSSIPETSSNVPHAYLFDGDAYGDVELGGLSPTVISKLRKHFSNKKIQRKLSTKLPAEMCNNGLLLEPTSDDRVYLKFASKYRGKLLHCLTLQNLAVGEAPSINLHNYKEDGLMCYDNSVSLLQHRNALRLRIEHFQLLLQFWSFYGMVHWFRNLSIGRDLSSLLDNRLMTRFKSIPRNFSSRNNALLEASAREASRLNHRLLIKGRDTNTSFESFLDRSSVMSSAGASSMDSLLSAGTSIMSAEVNEKTTADIFGDKIVCYENIYTPAEKQYISNCIPTLNSFDKWSGSPMTLSNYMDLLPKNDSQNINSKGKVFISPNTFNSLIKGHVKNVQRSYASMKNECKEFYVDDTGLVSLVE